MRYLRALLWVVCQFTQAPSILQPNSDWKKIIKNNTYTTPSQPAHRLPSREIVAQLLSAMLFACAVGDGNIASMDGRTRNIPQYHFLHCEALGEVRIQMTRCGNGSPRLPRVMLRRMGGRAVSGRMGRDVVSECVRAKWVFVKGVENTVWSELTVSAKEVV